ncbi:cytochrome b-c1 complex subunit 8 isoform X2 [Phascolarctos cinereus]|uniref:Cytochrome b-c1 complex subunit 8 n=1 Tax=Phascolarctos cinereus TaxID=38626 RepID=A0A6P5KMF7_PHACI|nr:cytochrome b-c1 complex subunit 8 [Phascolarctos cinereus]
MGREFGNLIRVRHIISYSLSPFEQRAFADYFTRSISNMLRRTQGSILRVVPPFIAFYFLYTWGNQEFENSKRKKPMDFEENK